MLEMPVIGAKVPSKRRPPMPMGGSPKPPAFPPPGIKLLPLKAKACSRNKLGPQPPPCPPPARLLQEEQMKRKQRLLEQPWVERQVELEARRMELWKAKSKLEEDAKTKETKLEEEAAGEKPHEVIELVMDSSEEENAETDPYMQSTDPHMQSKCLNKVRRPETDPYMQSKCLNKVRRPETDPYM